MVLWCSFTLFSDHMPFVYYFEGSNQIINLVFEMSVRNRIYSLIRCTANQQFSANYGGHCRVIVRRHNSSSLTLPDARQQWMDEAIGQMRKNLGRDLNAFQYNNQTNDVGEVLVKTYRVVCTDRFVPSTQISPSKHFGVYGRRVYADSMTESPVEISWEPMREDLHNVITVDDVQKKFNVSDQQMYGLDLLKLYLVAGETTYNRPMYFATEEFC